MAEKMILVFPVQPEKREEFATMLSQSLVDTRKYTGCLAAQCWLPENDDNAVWVYEEWETREDQTAYMKWRVETGMMEAIGPMLAGAPKTIWIDER